MDKQTQPLSPALIKEVLAHKPQAAAELVQQLQTPVFNLALRMPWKCGRRRRRNPGNPASGFGKAAGLPRGKCLDYLGLPGLRSTG